MRGSSDPNGALLLGLGAGVFFFFKGFRVFREYQVVEDTPRVPIRSAPMGLVHVRGKAQSEQLIPSPITGTRCCFYRVQIERYKSDSHGGKWEHYRTDSDGSKFYLNDETGRVLIDSFSAEYELPESPPRIVNSARLEPSLTAGASDQELLQYIETAGIHPMVDRVEHWLEKRGPLDDPRREQVRQTVLEMIKAVPHDVNAGGSIPAELVEKMVTALQPLADPKKEQERQMYLQHIREMGSITLPARAASMASGRYRLRESLILPGEEYQVMGTCVENPQSKDGQDRNMIIKGQSEKTFLISSKSDAETRSGLRKRAMGMVFGGAALALVCLGVLLAHWHMF